MEAPLVDIRPATELSAREIAAAVRGGARSARSVLNDHLAQIEALEPELRAFLRRPAALARSRAQALDDARDRGETLGPLAGVPVALKDIFVTRGVETSCGSKILAGWAPPYDSAHAERLERAGAVLFGKLTMDEFAMGSSNENTPFTPPRNPWDLTRVPGGSSGGSAACVAARMAAVSLGTDTGGSIRQPAGFCGVVGLKPTYGRVSRYGMVAFASSLDQAGPFARDVRDAARVLQCLAGFDPRDASSLREPVPDLEVACERGAGGLRVGVPKAMLDLPGLDPGVREAFERSVAALERAGASRVDIELPHARYAVACYYVLSPAEASSNLARFDGVRYGLRVEKSTLRETYEATRDAGFGPEVKRRILLGTFVLRADSYERYYGRAMRVRTLIARDYEAAFKTCDVIATPTSPTPAFPLGRHAGDPLSMYLSDVFTIGANLAGLPAISIPGGFTQAEPGGSPPLPIGFQLIGPRLGEPTLLAAAAAHEAVTDWHTRRPALLERRGLAGGGAS